MSATGYYWSCKVTSCQIGDGPWRSEKDAREEGESHQLRQHGKVIRSKVKVMKRPTDEKKFSPK